MVEHELVRPVTNDLTPVVGEGEHLTVLGRLGDIHVCFVLRLRGVTAATTAGSDAPLGPYALSGEQQARRILRPLALSSRLSLGHSRRLTGRYL